LAEAMDWTRLLFVLFGGLLELCFHVSANRGGSPSFTDEIPFKINWPGDEFTLPTSGALYKDDDFVIMTTTEKETYKCLLPSLSNGDDDDVKEYAGPTPGDLLEPLFKQSSCSYRIESYWTYEVCHGKHVRQYHEEKETGQIKLQEYILGSMTKKTESSTTSGTETAEAEKHEILSIAEVTTCEYEVVVLTHLICAHPKYRFKSSPVNAIFCQALSGSPLQPHSLSQMNREQEQLLKPPFTFCYGKHVHQYHEDKEQGKNMVVVGSWNTEEHLEWAQKNVARSYQLKNDGVQKVKLVSHFYGHGDVCDMTGKPRQVIVKLKCKESESPHAVTVYMLEPQTCQYVLGVESPVICQILDTADEKGLLSVSS
uniref:Endoplasmic reticulum lectin n=1 Tax=Salmo trutta TaxID=8032 RepID=A0A673YU56_SALTR